MSEQDTIRPHDVAVALSLLQDEDGRPTYAELGALLSLSPSTVHQSVQRMQGSGLLRPGTRMPNRRALSEFLTHGVRYAFPPILGRQAVGVPTAHSGPVLGGQFDAEDALVWPDVRGSVQGTSLTPLYPGATSLPDRAPEVYRLMTLVDAIRAGRARERGNAIAELHHRLHGQAGAAVGDA